MAKFSNSVLFIILVSSFLFPVSILALDPITIDKSVHSAPPAGANGKLDVNYHPNEILKNPNAQKCPGTLTITNSFSPKTGGTDANNQPVTQDYDVSQIKTSISLSDNYTNNGLRYAYLHLANRPNIIFGSDTDIQNAFHSFDIKNTNGTSNVATRATPYALLKCQRGQRLIKAVLSLADGSNQTTCNEQVGWNCGGSIYAFTQKTNSSGCTPIRLADIAAALASTKSFYDPDADCNSTPTPNAITLPVGVSDVNPVALAIATKLFNSAVEPIDNCSLARRVEVCNSDASGGCVNPTNSEHQMPLGAVEATSKNTTTQFISVTQKVKNYDLCSTTDTLISPDRPNPLTFKAIIEKAFGTVSDTLRTFSGTVEKNVYLPPELNPGVNSDQAFQNNLLPASVQSKYGTVDVKASTDGKGDIDPGIDITRTVFAKQLLPRNF